MFVTRIEGGDGHWALEPDWFSYSSFRELEACPRRWMLRRASFPAVWDRHGYPEVPYLASLRGDVVHRALEQIVER